MQLQKKTNPTTNRADRRGRFLAQLPLEPISSVCVDSTMARYAMFGTQHERHNCYFIIRNNTFANRLCWPGVFLALVMWGHILKNFPHDKHILKTSPFSGKHESKNKKSHQCDLLFFFFASPACRPSLFPLVCSLSCASLRYFPTEVSALRMPNFKASRCFVSFKLGSQSNSHFKATTDL